MKKKDILTIIAALTIIGFSVFAILQLLFPKSQEKVSTEDQINVPKIETTFDEGAYKAVSELSDYGLPEQIGIGKTDLFSE